MNEPQAEAGEWRNKPFVHRLYSKENQQVNFMDFLLGGVSQIGSIKCVYHSKIGKNLADDKN